MMPKQKTKKITNPSITHNLTSMKRISLLCAATAAAAFTMSAQKALVDEVKNEFKGNSGAAQAAIEKIQPALTNPETAESAYAWFTAGQAAESAYNHLRAMEGFSPQGLSNDQKIQAGRDLNLAYDYFLKALPLDQLPDAKGKVKPKYTKDIMKSMKDNYHDFMQAGIYLYEAGAYPDAITAWEHYITLPNIPELADAKIVADPDTIVGQMMYYQALAMAFDNNAQAGVARVRDAMNAGFRNPEVYRNGLALATQAQDSAAMSEFAQKGYELYGTQDIAFIGQLINDRLAKNDNEGCVELVNQALAAQPDVTTQAQLYDILGCLDLDQNKFDSAQEYFAKAVSLNPDFAKGYFDQARAIYNKAVQSWDDASEDVRNTTLKPEVLKACELFEKAYNIDEINMGSVPGILYRAYYLVEGEESPNTQKWHNM